MKRIKLPCNLNRGKIIFGAVTCWLVLFLWIGFAHAHKVTIFAWVEGDIVHTESKFSGGKKVKDSPVEVYDNLGHKLLEGKTDNNGNFSFNVPKKTEMKVVLLAGMGHRAEWTIPVEETETIRAEQTEPAPFQEPLPEKRKAQEEVLEISKQDTLKTTPEIDKSLDKKLDLIIKKLDEMQDHGSDLTDILGAIGYIFGLVGVAIYFNYRKKGNMSIS